MREAALQDAEKLPAQAQEEARVFLEKVRSDAELETHQILVNAQADQEVTQILSEAQEQADQKKALAAQHIQQAISFVIDRVTGKS